MLIAALAGAGCAGDAMAVVEVDAGGGPDGGPVDPGAHPGEVWLMTWNLQLFPKSSATSGKVEQILRDRPLDLIAVQEIDDVAAWDDLDRALGDYEGRLASDAAADTRVGLLFRPSTVTLDRVETLFPGDDYAFPRPPLLVDAQCQGIDFTVVVLHLKATSQNDSAARRRAAVEKLDAWVESEVAAGRDEDIVILGDWNDALLDPPAENVFQKMLDRPERYRFLTKPLEAVAKSQGGSYIPVGSFIDQVMITTAMNPDYGDAGETLLLKLDAQDPHYVSHVSDHRPVLVKLKPGKP
jgi:endonuclease/exonuclease/phosphatase family metal-dependent hydrolase